MAQYQPNVLDSLEYDPISELGIPGSIFGSSNLDSFWYPPYSSDFSPLQESTACTDATNYATFQALFIDSFDSPGTFDMLSPPLVNTDLIAVSPDVSIIRAQSPSTQSTITSPPGDTDEIVCHVEFHNSFQFYHPNGNRSTKKTDSSMIEVSLHERFAKVMNLVRRLPSAERPKNALFTPFFTRKDDLYVCLLCPTKVAKSITNRTQIIQHITGRHGERRPFACPSCPHRAIRKADLDKHTNEIHGPSKYYCSSCSKLFSNKRNTRRHEKFCLVSTPRPASTKKL